MKVCTHNYIVFLLCLLGFSANAFAPYSGAEDEEDEIVRRQYVLSYGALAIEEMKRSGVPASITLAQGILESEWGRATLAKKNNNHFGIKCSSGWRGGCAMMTTLEDYGVITAGFRKYPRVEESYLDHTELLMNDSRYGRLFDYHHLDYRNWARGLKKSGYATDDAYDKKLIKIIEYNRLFELDDHYSKAMPSSMEDIIPLLRITQKGPIAQNAIGEEIQMALTSQNRKKKAKK